MRGLVRVLSRGIGSLDFIQRQLAPDDEINEGLMKNVHGSSTRRLTVGVTAGTSEISGYLDPTPSETQEVQDNPPTQCPTPDRQPDPERPGPPTPPVPE